MASRRSKRLCSVNATTTVSEDTDAPVRKRRTKLVYETDTKSGKHSSVRSTADSRSDGKNDLKPATDHRRPTRNSVQSTKSSYFESPVTSEDSQSEAESSSKPSRNRKSNIRANDVKLKFESPDESEESDLEREISKPIRKRKRMTRPNDVKSKKKSPRKREDEDSSNEFVETESSVPSVEKTVRGFESESDSSSNDDTKLDRKTVTSQSSLLFDPLESDDETTVDTKPGELFDFTALVSQITEATSEEKETKPDTKLVISAESEPRPSTSKKKSSRNKKTTTTKSSKTEGMEVFELLAMGEKTDMSAKDIKESVAKAQEEYEIPKQVEIVLDAPILKKKKRCDDLEMALRRRLNNIRRENQVYIHKVHVLCWIAHGMYLNGILNSADLLGPALSLLPNEKCYPPKCVDIKYLEDLINWFAKKVKLKKDPIDNERINLIVSLQKQFEKLEAETKFDFCLMFICVFRSLGMKCRLIINLNVAPIKPTSDQLLPVMQKKEDEKLKASTSEKKKETNRKLAVKESEKKPEEKVEKQSVSVGGKKIYKGKKIEEPKSIVEKKSFRYGKNENENGSRRSSRISNSKSSYFDRHKNEKSSSSNIAGKKSKESKLVESEKDVRRSFRLTNSKSIYFVEKASNGEQPKKTKSKQRPVEKKSTVATQKRTEDLSVEEMSSSDSDDSAVEFRSPKNKKINRKVISTDEDAETTNEKSEAKSNKQTKKTNYWIEVYLEEEEKWASVDIVNKEYLCDDKFCKNASAPIRYVLAWNNDQTIKDVTKRYACQFLTVTRKHRADDDWWSNTMVPFKPLSTPREREEDEELDKKLELQELPKSISEYKNHPLYVLPRHLLKFQAIYPPDAKTVGFIGKEGQKEPVYSRSCVVQLHGREMWIKEAKVVKLNEKPYKIVKGRQKKDKFGIGEGPRDLELFGLWQVEDYVPPTAENGKVPRNAFGNVELFKMSMLPKGTVYLQIPGLQRIANKLNIDCAAAITGFDYSTNGWSYPIKDGFVVCEEYKDILLDAFNQEVEEAEKKEKQKREERVYGNWKRLIRGLFIAEKLKRKYNFGEPSAATNGTEASTSKGSKAKTKK